MLVRVLFWFEALPLVRHIWTLYYAWGVQLQIKTHCVIFQADHRQGQDSPWPVSQGRYPPHTRLGAPPLHCSLCWESRSRNQRPAMLTDIFAFLVQIPPVKIFSSEDLDWGTFKVSPWRPPYWDGGGTWHFSPLGLGSFLLLVLPCSPSLHYPGSIKWQEPFL